MDEVGRRRRVLLWWFGAGVAIQAGLVGLLVLPSLTSGSGRAAVPPLTLFALYPLFRAIQFYRQRLRGCQADPARLAPHSESEAAMLAVAATFCGFVSALAFWPARSAFIRYRRAVITERAGSTPPTVEDPDHLRARAHLRRALWLTMALQLAGLAAGVTLAWHEQSPSALAIYLMGSVLPLLFTFHLYSLWHAVDFKVPVRARSELVGRLTVMIFAGAMFGGVSAIGALIVLRAVVAYAHLDVPAGVVAGPAHPAR